MPLTNIRTIADVSLDIQVKSFQDFFSTFDTKLTKGEDVRTITITFMELPN